MDATLSTRIASLKARVSRLGVVLEANGDPTEAEGVLNPAVTRARDGKLLLYPRAVERGNRSRIALVEGCEGSAGPTFVRLGFALEPEEPYERSDSPIGYGCEDPRVTFVPLLDLYVMAYTAFGPSGPRIAFALSHDGYAWTRLGLPNFSAVGLPAGDDKDAAFFPGPVLSPRGVLSFAFYHRPMPPERGVTRIAYVPAEAALSDPRSLLEVAESAIVLERAHGWGRVKNGAGTPPVRIEEGWLSFFHGVDVSEGGGSVPLGVRYSAGIVIHDAQRPDIVRYRSMRPILVPETDEEIRGVVNNVVFPTGLDIPPNAPPRVYDVYYGMADTRIGRVRVQLGESQLEADTAA